LVWCVHLDASLDPGLLGLGLTYIVGLAGMFQFCVRQSAELENQVCICYFMFHDVLATSAYSIGIQ